MASSSNQIRYALGAGFGIGWLVGLSEAPVVAALLAALVPAAIAAINLVNKKKGSEQGQTPKETDGQQYLLGGVSVMCIGLAVGATGGLLARGYLNSEQNLFAIEAETKGLCAPSVSLDDLESEAKHWEKLVTPRGDGIKVSESFFSAYLSLCPGLDVNLIRDGNEAIGGLHGSKASACDELLNSDDGRLIMLLQSSDEPELQRLAVIGDAASARSRVKNYCEEKK